jgi:hypothetical protein
LSRKRWNGWDKWSSVAGHFTFVGVDSSYTLILNVSYPAVILGVSKAALGRLLKYT